MRKFTVVHLDESRSAPGGRQLIGQGAKLSPPVSCYRPNIRLFVLVLNHEVDTTAWMKFYFAVFLMTFYIYLLT